MGGEGGDSKKEEAEGALVDEAVRARRKAKAAKGSSGKSSGRRRGKGGRV